MNVISKLVIIIITIYKVKIFDYIKSSNILFFFLNLLPKIQSKLKIYYYYFLWKLVKLIKIYI